MNDQLALSIATRITMASPSLQKQAWQHLHDTGLATAVGLGDMEQEMIRKGMIEESCDGKDTD